RTPPPSPPFPYTTLFRSLQQTLQLLQAGARVEEIEQAQAEVQEATEAWKAARKSADQVAQKQQEVVTAEAEVRKAQKAQQEARLDRKSTRLNSSHDQISY